MHTRQELLEAYNYIDLKSCTFGAGLKNFKWTPNETTAFLDCLANAVSSECREIIKSKSSQLKTQKIKVWFVFHNNFLQKNTDSRLRHCTMEQLKNKLKTEEKKTKEPDINKWNNNCSRTGGGRNEINRPGTPDGDDIIIEDSNPATKTMPQTAYLIDPSTGLSEGEVLLAVVSPSRSVAPKPPPQDSHYQGPGSSCIFDLSANPGTSKHSNQHLHKKHRSRSEVEAKEKKKRMTNEEENWNRNRQSDVLAEDTMRMQQMIRLKNQIEIEVLCLNNGITCPHE